MKLNRRMHMVIGAGLFALMALYLLVAAAFLLPGNSRNSEIGDGAYLVGGVFALLLASVSGAAGGLTLHGGAAAWPWAMLAGPALALTLASLWPGGVFFGWSIAAFTAGPMAFIAALAAWRAAGAAMPRGTMA
jgi:hypothetical protein